jgi:glycosyltransferase involved in cell wall biosynthesis
MSKTLLLLAYHFPPENVSGAARPFRFYRYLPEFGISPVVITASPQNGERSDVVFIRDVPRDFPRQTWSWHMERIVRKLFLPGALGLTWSREAAAQGCKLIQAYNRPIVLSTAPPFSTHLAALMIKRKLGIPWIADFRDPMASVEIVVPRMNIYSILESFLFDRADAIIANTDAVHNLWSARYPSQRGKIHVIWNGFDPDEVISPASIPQRDFKSLVHVGELYGGRHPGPILDSIQRLTACGALAPGSLRLSLIGPSSDAAIPNIDVLRRLVNAGIVEYVPLRIPQNEARLIARQADALLLLQPHTNVHVPAKLFEYIRIGRPVLAFVKRDSPTERILSRCGIVYRSIYPDDPPEEVDIKMLEFLALPSDPVSPNKWFDEQFNARRQTQTLSSIIDGLPGLACRT